MNSSRRHVSSIRITSHHPASRRSRVTAGIGSRSSTGSPDAATQRRNRWPAVLVSAALAVTGFLGTSGNAWAAGDGTPDTGFTTNTGTGFNNHVQAVAVQSNDTIIAGGYFTGLDGNTTNRIARLDTDGTPDTTFTTNTGGGFDSTVFGVALQSDGKIIVGGSFDRLKGATTNRIARLNADGTPDTTFTTNTGGGFDTTVHTVAVQSDDKIIAGGNFTGLGSGTPTRIARLEADGTPETTFTTNTGTGFNDRVYALAVQSDGKIIVGGNFTDLNNRTVNYIARLNADGTPDTTFTTNTGGGFDSTVHAVAVQSDGKIIVGGSFTGLDGNTTNRIARLEADGTPDTTFTTNTGTGFNNPVYTVSVQSDDTIIVGGHFNSLDSDTANYIARLDADGTPDTTFTTNTGTGFPGAVNAVSVQSDGGIIVGGSFRSLNSETAERIARLAGSAGGSGSGGSSGALSDPSGGVPPVLQQYVLPADQSGDADSCATNAPAHVVDDRTTSDQRYEGWSVSYAQWPHDGSGGWVCTRTLHYRAASDMWIAGSSVITGSGDLQQYAIPSLVALRDNAAEGLTDAQVRTAYCRANAPDDPTLGSTWGARNEGWRPTYAEWAGGGAGGWVCSRTV